MTTGVRQPSRTDDLRRCSRAEIAELFGVGLKTIDNWVRRGCPVLERGGRGQRAVMDVIAVAEWRFGARTAGDNVDPETLPPAERKQWYEGEKHRRAIQVEDRELIPIAELEEVIGTAYASIAQTLLSMPDLMERRAGLPPDVAEQAEIIIHEAMSDLADRLQSFASIEEVA
jgi:terminase small subunit / prophage DNA-packing protein